MAGVYNKEESAASSTKSVEGRQHLRDREIRDCLEKMFSTTILAGRKKSHTSLNLGRRMNLTWTRPQIMVGCIKNL